jgi:hypothetical protein
VVSFTARLLYGPAALRPGYFTARLLYSPAALRPGYFTARLLYGPAALRPGCFTRGKIGTLHFIFILLFYKMSNNSQLITNYLTPPTCFDNIVSSSGIS